MPHFLYMFLLFFCPLLSFAQERLQEAEDSYSNMQYKRAATLLIEVADSIEKSGGTPSSDIYYNLGNAYYRQQQYTEATLFYLRALRIRPDFEHAKVNLRHAQLHLGLQEIEHDEMFFVKWFKMFINAYSVEQWTAFSFLFLILSFVAIAVYFLPIRIFARKIGFSVAVFTMLSTTFCIVNASIQRYRYHHNTQAVIFAPETRMLTSPSPHSKEISKLREGQIITVLNDDSAKGWVHVCIAGTTTKGWMTDNGYKRVIDTHSPPSGKSTMKKARR